MDKELSLFQITAQYVADVQAGRQPRLSDYLASYPRYANAIADFVAYYHAVEERVSSMDAIPLTGIMMPSIDATEGYTVDLVSVAEPMTTLLMTATGQRLTFSQIATELDLSRDIILLLEQRAIAPATIPRMLYEQIAMLLQQPCAVVQQYLSSLDLQKPGSAVQNRKQRIKVAEANADYSVPYVIDKPGFRAIVETSLQLSVEQRSRWCTILDTQGI